MKPHYKKRKPKKQADAETTEAPAESESPEQAPELPPAELPPFVKFEYANIHRSKIKGAEWNPRTITEKERAKLRAGIEDGDIGLLEPLVWNKRTGTLVGGHQRLSVMDTLTRSKNYLVPVAVVDLDEKTEKAACVLLNNESAQGDWDIEKFGALFKGDDRISHEKAGLDLGDMYQLFGETMIQESPAAMIELSQRVRDAKAKQQEIVEKKAERDADYFYACLVFKDRAMLLGFLQRMGLPSNIFIDGRQFEMMLDAAGVKPAPSSDAT